MRVLLIEDDPLVASGIVSGLRLHGLQADHLARCDEARAALRSWHFDIVVLDLGLPDGDGMALLQGWRAQGEGTPVLVLTARDAVEHRVAGLRAGADDYLVKPFDLDELVARLQALVRRAGGRSVDRYEHGDIVFTPSTGEVTRAGRPVALSRRETALLHALLLRPRQILSVERLRGSLYGYEADVESNTVNVYVHHLRRKLGAAVIETVRGIGFRLGPADPDAQA